MSFICIYYKLQFVSSVAAALWEQSLKAQWYDRFGEVDNWVTQLIELVQRRDPQEMNTIGNGLASLSMLLIKKLEGIVWFGQAKYFN